MSRLILPTAIEDRSDNGRNNNKDGSVAKDLVLQLHESPRAGDWPAEHFAVTWQSDAAVVYRSGPPQGWDRKQGPLWSIPITPQPLEVHVRDRGVGYRVGVEVRFHPETLPVDRLVLDRKQLARTELASLVQSILQGWLAIRPTATGTGDALDAWGPSELETCRLALSRAVQAYGMRCTQLGPMDRVSTADIGLTADSQRQATLAHRLRCVEVADNIRRSSPQRPVRWWMKLIPSQRMAERAWRRYLADTLQWAAAQLRTLGAHETNANRAAELRNWRTEMERMVENLTNDRVLTRPRFLSWNDYWKSEAGLQQLESAASAAEHLQGAVTEMFTANGEDSQDGQAQDRHAQDGQRVAITASLSLIRSCLGQR